MPERWCLQRARRSKTIPESVVAHDHMQTQRRHSCSRTDKLQLRCSPLCKVHGQGTWRGRRCYESRMALCRD